MAADRPNITSLNIEQLRSLSKQFKEELSQLSQSAGQLDLAIAKYKESRSAVETLENAEKDNDNKLSLMVPLTNSMYIPAKALSNLKVTVEIGSGYFVKKTTEEAKKFFARKIAYVEKSIDIVEKQIMTTRNNLESVHQMINLRVQQQMAANTNPDSNLNVENTFSNNITHTTPTK